MQPLSTSSMARPEGLKTFLTHQRQGFTQCINGADWTSVVIPVEDVKVPLIGLIHISIYQEVNVEFGYVSGRVLGVTRGRARVLVKVKFGRKLWLFVPAYSSERDDTKRAAFWNDLDDCLQNFGENVNTVVSRDMSVSGYEQFRLRAQNTRKIRLGI